MQELLIKIGWVKLMAGAVVAVLGVFIAWNSLGWDTIAMSSEVAEVKARVVEVSQQAEDYYTEQKGENNDTKLMILYFRLSDYKNDFADEERKLELDPLDGVAAERIKNITENMGRIQRLINKIEGVSPSNN